MASSLERNAAEHPVVATGDFATVDEYLNYLMHKRAFEELERMVSGADVLDLGCNNGYGTDMLRTSARSIVGVDVSTPSIEDGRARYPGLDLQDYDGRTLPFPDASFDIVVSLQVIEHIDVDLVPRYLSETARVLRPGGSAAFTTPNALVRLTPGLPPWNAFHVREFSADELREELAAHFESVEVRGMVATPGAQQRILDLYVAARAAQQRALQRSWKTTVKGAAPWLVPLVRRVRAARQQPSISLDPASMAGYSTADFAYVDDGLDGALDFLAVCRAR